MTNQKRSLKTLSLTREVLCGSQGHIPDHLDLIVFTQTGSIGSSSVHSMGYSCQVLKKEFSKVPESHRLLLK